MTRGAGRCALDARRRRSFFPGALSAPTAVGAALGLALGWPAPTLAVLGGFLLALGYFVVLTVIEKTQEMADAAREVRREFQDPYDDRGRRS